MISLYGFLKIYIISKQRNFCLGAVQFQRIFEKTEDADEGHPVLNDKISTLKRGEYYLTLIK